MIRLWTVTHIVIMLLLLGFLRKLSKHTENIPRRYLFYAMTGVFSWVFFDFLLVNASSIMMANIAFNFVLLSVSISFGFFFLSCMSFTHKCTSKCKLVATTPLLMYLILLTTTTSTMLLETQIGFQIEPNAYQIIWMITGDTLVIYGIIEMLKLKTRIKNKKLQRRIMYFTAPVFLAVIIGSSLILLSAVMNVWSSASVIFSSLVLLMMWLAFRSPE